MKRIFHVLDNVMGASAWDNGAATLYCKNFVGIFVPLQF